LNLKFLGDALDHWKGSLFAALQRAQVVQNFLVEPVFSDSDDWRPDDRRIYAQLLGGILWADRYSQRTASESREVFCGDPPAVRSFPWSWYWNWD